MSEMVPGLRTRKLIDFTTILCLEMTTFIHVLKMNLRWCQLFRNCTHSWIYKPNCCLEVQKQRNLSIFISEMRPGLRHRKWIDFITFRCLEMTLLFQVWKLKLWWCHLLRKWTHPWFYNTDCCLDTQQVSYSWSRLASCASHKGISWRNVWIASWNAEYAPHKGIILLNVRFAK